MDDAFDIMQIPECSANLGEDVPDDFLFDLVLFLRLTQDEVSQRNSIQQLHDDVNVLATGKRSVVSGDVRVV